MAQRNYEEKVNSSDGSNANSKDISFFEVEPTRVITGDADRQRYLYYQLKISMLKAKKIDIIISFLMESGVRLLLNDLKKALDRGVKIRLLTGNYLGITHPSALYLIKDKLGDQVDLRFYNEKDRSFHPKAYIFHGEKDSEIYIGSSNMSKSALTSGIEWNYRLNKHRDEKSFNQFSQTFEELFTNHSIIIDDKILRDYSKAWKKPAVAKDIERLDEGPIEDKNVEEFIRPRGAQIEALYSLKNVRDEGADKGLVYAATGERVIIVMDAVFIIKSRVSGTLNKYISCIA